MPTPFRCLSLLAALTLVMASSGTPAPAAPPETKPPRSDAHGDPLPDGAVARLGTVRLRHAGLVRSVLFSPDGKTLYSGSEDDTVRAWDSATGKPRGVVSAKRSGWGLRLSPDGRTLGGVLADGITLYDLRTGETCVFPAPSRLATSLAFSPDGKTVATGEGVANSGVPTRIRLWELVTGKEVRSFHDQSTDIYALVFTPDGKTLISGGRDGVLRFWDPTTGKQFREIRGTDESLGEVWSLAVSPDGRTVATAAADVRLWNVATGKQLARLQGHSRPVYGVACSPDGRRVASIGQDGALILWNVATEKVLWKEGLVSATPCMAPAFSPDGKSLAAPVGSTIGLWNVATGKRLRKQDEHEQSIHAVAFSPNGRLLAVGSHDGTVSLWDVATRKRRHRLPCGGPVMTLAFSPDSKLLAVGDHDRKVLLWDVASGKELQRLTGSVPEHAYPGVISVAFSADGREVVARVGYIYHAWEVSTGRKLSRGSATGFFAEGALSPDGRLLVLPRSSGGKDLWLHTGSGMAYGNPTIQRFVEVRNAGSGIELARLTAPVEQLPRQMEFKAWPSLSSPPSTFSPDGRLYLIGGHLWELASGKEVWSRPEVVRALAAFSADGSTLAVIQRDGYFELLEAWTSKVLARRKWSEGKAVCLAVSPDSKLLATGHPDGNVLLWELPAAPAKPRRPDRPLAAHEFERLWAGLGDPEPAKAYENIEALSSPDAVAYLKDRLRPGATATDDRAARLIAALDSPRFRVRDAALRDLKALGGAAGPALAEALANGPSLEVRRRIETLLGEVKAPASLVPPGDPLRAYRAVLVLERIGSREARDLLVSLARGPSASLLTRQAKAALERLSRR